MGTISSSTGLISGLDIESIVSQLIAIEARTKDQVDTRIEEQTNRQTALLGLQAKVMAIQVSAASFNKDQIFEQKAVSISNEDVLTATATKLAQKGSYNLTVKQLASTHQFISRGYSSIDSSVGAGTITFEMGNGQVARQTLLDQLNGGQGIQRGQIEITDRSGQTAVIDLRTAQTVQDVLDEINYSSKINVTASVSGGRIVINDNTGGTGNLVVADLRGGHTATDLGIAANVAASTIDGNNIARIGVETLLKSLNDGNGIRGVNSGSDDLKFTLADGTVLNVGLKSQMHHTVGDPASKATTLQSLNSGAGVRGGMFRITDQNGRSVDIDMDDFKDRYGSRGTLTQLENYIKEQIQRQYPDGEMKISFAFNAMDHIVLKDESTLEYRSGSAESQKFTIEDLDGGSAAADLGIAGSVNGTTINGTQVWFMETVGDVINAVNNHWDNNGSLKLQINSSGKGLQVLDLSAGAGSLTVEANGEDNFAALDLGLLTLDSNNNGRSLTAGLNTVLLRSLNGGSGSTTATEEFARGTLTIQGSGGGSATMAFDAGSSLNDVIEWINNSGTGLSAQVNSVGNGLILKDDNDGALSVSGDLADFLNIARDTADGVSSVNSGNLQLQYISETTALKDLRQGEGIRLGTFKLTDGTGVTKDVDLAQDGIKTIEDVINKINTAGTNVRARINDTGDGILLYDTSEGDNLQAIKVANARGSSVASDLGLLKTATKQADGSYILDGSYEYKLEVGGGDSIDDIVTRINDADMGLQAGLINDGNNYRISFVSEVAGRAGNIFLDPGSTNLSTETLSTGQDALVLLGGTDTSNPLLITSRTNTLKEAVKGVTIELQQVSDTPVNLEIDQDIDGIVTQMKNFVTSFNEVMKLINDQASYDVATETKGILYAEHSVSTVRQALINMVQRTVPGLDTYNRLSDVGVHFAPMAQETAADANGDNKTYAVAGVTQLDFDESEFREAFEADPDAVVSLFLQETSGIGDYIGGRLENLASTTSSSTMKISAESIGTSIDLLKKRSEYLQQRLDAKEQSLYNQFYQMELALSNMQSQQSALSQLGSLISG